MNTNILLILILSVVIFSLLSGVYYYKLKKKKELKYSFIIFFFGFLILHLIVICSIIGILKYSSIIYIAIGIIGFLEFFIFYFLIQNPEKIPSNFLKHEMKNKEIKNTMNPQKCSICMNPNKNNLAKCEYCGNQIF